MVKIINIIIKRYEYTWLNIPHILENSLCINKVVLFLSLIVDLANKLRT